MKNERISTIIAVVTVLAIVVFCSIILPIVYNAPNYIFWIGGLIFGIAFALINVAWENHKLRISNDSIGKALFEMETELFEKGGKA